MNNNIFNIYTFNKKINDCKTILKLKNNLDIVNKKITKEENYHSLQIIICKNNNRIIDIELSSSLNELIFFFIHPIIICDMSFFNCFIKKYLNMNKYILNNNDYEIKNINEKSIINMIFNINEFIDFI